MRTDPECYLSIVAGIDAGLRRFITASITLGLLEPFPLACTGLEVRRDGCDILATCDHCAAHFVAIRVNCEGTCISIISSNKYAVFRTYEIVARKASAH